MKLETPISPKVIVSVIVGIVLTALVSNISAITPDMLDFLGPWKLFVFGTLITTIMGLAGWWKTDPLRTGYIPEDPTATETPAPAAVVANAPATAAEPAAPTTFTATAQKINALPENAPVPSPAPVEVAPIIPN